MRLEERARDAWTEVRQQVATIDRPTADVITRRSRRGRVAISTLRRWSPRRLPA